MSRTLTVYLAADLKKFSKARYGKRRHKQKASAAALIA
jgi:hypothetical protein